MLAAAAVLAVAGGFAMLRNGALAADRTPMAIEAAVARRLVNLSIPASQRAATNPLIAPDTWRSAADDFRGQCAMCHGNDGRGRTPIGPRMYPPVPDLAAPEIQQFSDGALFSIIRHGVSWTGMPAFRSSHSDEQTWRLVAFVRQVPKLTAADLATPASAAGGDDRVKTVVMEGTQFQPGDITVNRGDTIVWINRDFFPHNVSAKTGGFRSTDLDPDQSFRFQAKEAGTFPYVCTLHPTMAAVIHVR